MTKATFFVEEDKILTSLFEEGMENLHLCKPDSEPVYSERLLTLLSEDYYKKITVHDHFYLREEFGLKGIHLYDPNSEKPYGYKGNITCTCRSISELQDAKKKFDYVFLRTVFDSQNNAEHKQTLTCEELKEAGKKGLIDKHVYAMGGVCLDNIRQAKDYGFGGVVVCSDLWNRFNIQQEQDFKELILHFNKLQKAVN